MFPLESISGPSHYFIEEVDTGLTASSSPMSGTSTSYYNYLQHRHGLTLLDPSQPMVRIASAKTLQTHFHPEEAALPSLLAMFTTGVRETLDLHTAHGSFPSPLPLPSSFSPVPSLEGHLLSECGHPLHQCWVQYWAHTSQSLTVLVLAPDYSRLSLLVSLLRTMLPHDKP